MWVLLALMLLDVVSGLVRAFVEKDLSSEEMLLGGAKKVLIWVVIAVASLVERLLPALSGILRNGVVLFYCGAEALSILENAAAADVGLPEELKAALRKLNPEKLGYGEAAKEEK